ncbi:hypothetical protein N5079_30390 [Planotetraspora sp. A-T 1434]|uniref:hypothetical protein n=1 Tax=Planotetraspora sp. A-T 1434 TaxID=2979219 RepID=UPI0021C021CC|nr:hypothetical protein [Planotetraspora sp. A-T 1434]MCT9934523.1 hypothetical protein [Planotetraspora sp. A-T 1434]
MSVTLPAAPPIPAELEALFRRMRFPYARKAAPDVLATARAQRWDPSGLRANARAMSTPLGRSPSA